MGTQKSPECFRFTHHDKRRLAVALAGATESRVYVRLKAVLLIAEGKRVLAVARLFDKRRSTLYNWIAVYRRERRPEALLDAPRSGRPLVAQAITDERILEELKRNPLPLGYQTTVWTVETLARQLSQRYGCEIRPFTLYRRMKQIGLVCKRPRYVYAEKDPNRAQKKGRSYES